MKSTLKTLWKVGTAWLVVMTLISCANVPAASSQNPFASDGETHATLTVYRPDTGTMGVAVAPYVFIDGHKVGTMNSKDVRTVRLRPGRHLVEVQSYFLGIPDGQRKSLSLETHQDKKHFVVYRPFFKQFTVIPIPGAALVSGNGDIELIEVDEARWIRRE